MARLFIRINKLSVLILGTVFLILGNCSAKENLIVDYLNSEIEYWGRIDTSSSDCAVLYWSGTSIRLNFEGTSIEALIKDENGNNYYNIIVDNKTPYVLQPGTQKKYYKLADNLGKGKHTVEIFKRTEWDRGITEFYGFKLSPYSKVLSKPAEKKRKIEFYGNSITAGYAVEDFSGKDRSDSIFTNNFYSYSRLTATHFDAEYRCICKSGIGITISWFPLIMPEMYDRLDPSDPTSQWDFTLYQPDIVVVNLFQNDSWLVNRPERAEFKQNFGDKAPSKEYLIEAYQNFIVSLRNKYPKANIICILGNMDATRKGSEWPGYIEQAVKNINDNNIFTHFIPYKETSCHPSIKEQEDMAKSLIKFIDENINW